MSVVCGISTCYFCGVGEPVQDVVLSGPRERLALCRECAIALVRSLQATFDLPQAPEGALDMLRSFTEHARDEMEGARNKARLAHIALGLIVKALDGSLATVDNGSMDIIALLSMPPPKGS